MTKRGNRNAPEPSDGFTSVDGEPYCRFSHYDRKPSFLMSIASDTDLWLFIASSGGLTAGRVDAERSLFPYETADKLHDGHHHTGPITLLRVRRDGASDVLWQPFSERSADDPAIERNLYKNTIGNRIIFEEVNHDLDLVFRYRWSGSDDFGLVRTATLANRGAGAITVELLDGLRNVLPYGAPLALHQQSSSLIDAYKRTDHDPDTQLAIFSLTSRIIDRPEAAEELRANVVWCHGLSDVDVCLSIDAVAAFRRGEPVRPDRVLTGRRGNYLVASSLALAAGADAKWHIAADVARDHVQIAALRKRLLEVGDLDGAIEQSLLEASENLRRNVASADGIQLTGHAEAAVHHFANVLFNNMRGGVFANNYDISTADFLDFLQTRNRTVAERHAAMIEAWPEQLPLPELLDATERTGDADLQRLGHEYLPIYFGRRHGDPSRPWNRFAIHVKNADGTRALHYEGNWRDIFQNWEALSASFPGFLPGIIARFVNASTVDGFNPYRITRDGIDWEVVDPDDPWSHIGYWGDHQIVYLLKFLEALTRYDPGALERLLEREIFCYADVPYRLAPYENIVDDPHATIAFDRGLAARIDDRVGAIGTDGKLLPAPDGSIYHVNLLEKLLVPVLSKLSNLVPDGGIWMNTQRPEWNDANNALVGYGVSMVTLCYLGRYLRFFESLLADGARADASISAEVVEWCDRVRSVLDENRHLLDADTLSDGDRKRVLDALGGAFSDYREAVYAGGFSARRTVPIGNIVALCRVAREYLEHAIRANRREDGLYHSYNLLDIPADRKSASLRSLYEMLEGQVAALSSGMIEPAEAGRLLSSLFASRMYRDDQRSFMLYPARELPGFLERNVVPDESVRSVPLLRELVDAGDRSVIARDAFGVCRFHGDFKNARDVADALGRLAARDRWAKRVAADRQAVLDVFEAVFDHRSFTGRSGTMYGYEGLGCIYWHMVGKLLLAVQEIALPEAREGQRAPVRNVIAKYYYRIRAGLGFEKTAAEFGAFPTDPYSHTPAHAGAQQPGMTGQVKEEILTRFGELGVIVENGIVSFRPVLLRRNEFLTRKDTYRFYDLAGKMRSIDVPAGALAFTFCQVPVIYELTRGDGWVRVTADDDESSTRDGDALDAHQSRVLFGRLGGISRIDVGVPERLLLRD